MLGLMATGKTTIGRHLAARLGYPFSDSDASLVAGGRGSAADRARAVGLDALHIEEYEVFLAALAGPPPSVVAGAGSVLDHPDLAADLLGHIVIGVTAPEPVMRRRFRGSGHRPRLDGDPIGSTALRADRLVALQGVCDVVVTNHRRSVTEIVEELAVWVTGRLADERR
jgi:shikimate kinase